MSESPARPTKKRRLDVPDDSDANPDKLNVKPRWREIKEEFARKTDEVFQELEHKTEALEAAMELLFTAGHFYGNWEDFPDVLRKDNDVMFQFVLHSRCFLSREDFPDEALKQFIPRLCSGHRDRALSLVGKGFLTWEEVQPTSNEWKGSVSLSFFALNRCLVQSMADVPALSQEMLVTAVKDKIMKFDCLPLELQNNIGFCRSVLDRHESDETVREQIPHAVVRMSRCVNSAAARLVRWDELEKTIFRLHPQLQQDPQVWENIVGPEHKICMTIYKLIDDGIMPPAACADIVEKMCRVFASLLSRVDQIVFQDVVRKLIAENAEYVSHLKSEFIRAFPDYVKEKLSGLKYALANDPDDAFFRVNTLASEIPGEMWNDEELVRDWFGAGLGITESHPEDWFSDRAKYLFVAEHGATRDIKELSFSQLSNELRDDVDFIEKAMKFDPYLFRYASDTVRKNNTALLVWFLGDPEAARDTLRRASAQNVDSLQRFLQRAVQQVDSHDAFVSAFLCGACRSDAAVSMLGNQRVFLESIFTFVGLPRGVHLARLRRMVANLAPMLAELAEQSQADHGTGDEIEED